jgi:hypothetical protein
MFHVFKFLICLLFSLFGNCANAVIVKGTVLGFFSPCPCFGGQLTGMQRSLCGSVYHLFFHSRSFFACLPHPCLWQASLPSPRGGEGVASQAGSFKFRKKRICCDISNQPDSVFFFKCTYTITMAATTNTAKPM